MSQLPHLADRDPGWVQAERVPPTRIGMSPDTARAGLDLGLPPPCWSGRAWLLQTEYDHRTIWPVDRLRHGYTNQTRRVAEGVEKRYPGFEAFARANREVVYLTRLIGRFPVPEVLLFNPSVPKLLMRDVVGRHGQELMAEGHEAFVLRLIGNCLAELQSLGTTVVPEFSQAGVVIVHGDFGPQNILFSPDLTSVCAVLDWEFAHIGSPIEDIAWAEWTVRMHHPDSLEYLPQLFAGAGSSFPWSKRQAAMVLQCQRYIALCEGDQSEAAAAVWRQRLRTTESWNE